MGFHLPGGKDDLLVKGLTANHEQIIVLCCYSRVVTARISGSVASMRLAARLVNTI